MCGFLRIHLYLPLLLAALLFLPESADASYLDCLERSQGLELRWSAAWGDDNADNNVRYRVVSVDIFNRIPNRSVTLALRATGRAQRLSRSYKVTTEERARPVCDRLERPQTALHLPSEVGGEDQRSDVRNLPFIAYGSEGWVRADPPSSRGSLVLCRVLEQRFSCLSDEKDRFGSALKAIEEELRWKGQRARK